jgi:hypothetical protein
MIGRALIGAVAAAVAMFIIGFIFFATPLNGIGTRSVEDAQAAAVQTALAQNLPATGTYAVPSDATAGQTTLYGRGPIATIHYTVSGYVSSFRERAKLLILGTLGATIFMRLGEPIWFHHDWGNAIYLFIADTVSLIVAGLIILKMLPRTQAAAAAAPAAAAPAEPA